MRERKLHHRNKTIIKHMLHRDGGRNKKKRKNVKLYQHGFINKIFTFQLSVFIIHTLALSEIIKTFNDINLNCHLI